MKVQIYDLDPTDVEKLKAKATQLGYSGHVEMLRDFVTRLAHEDVVLQSDQRYLDVLSSVMATLQFVDQTMTVSIAEGLLADPFTDRSKAILNSIEEGEKTNAAGEK